MASTALPGEALLRAQEQNLSHSERIETLGLHALDRKVPSLNVAGSIVSARVNLTIQGASTLEIGVHDPDWLIERSGLLDKDRDGRLDAVVVTIDSLRFRLAKAVRQDTTLTLTFEDEVWALLRAHRSRLASSRNSLTRAQFIERMVGEIKVRDVPFFAPEKGRKQPVALPDMPAAKPATGSTGFDKGTRFKIKDATADPTQMREVATALTVADQLDVPLTGVVRLALICAGIGESEFRNIPNRAGSGYTGVFQAAKGLHLSTEQQARAFLKGGQGFQAGGAIAAHRQNPGWSPGEIALNVEGSRSNFASYALGVRHYQEHHDEAVKIADAWNGGDGGASSHEAVRVKSYRFTRGMPGQPENSAQAAVRLADEVAWRFFIQGGVVWFVDDYWLLTRAADLVLEGFDAPGLIGRPSYEWDHRKLAAGVSFRAAANAWSILPGRLCVLRDMGPVTGRWIVESFEFDLLDALDATVTLTKPVKPKREPAPDVFTVATGDSAPGAGSANKAVSWARGKIGHYAEEFGNNRGSELDALERKFGMQGAPWCAIFATTALVMGGVSRECRTAAVAQINAWASAGTHGFQKGSRATPRAGDLMTFGNDHVALVEKVNSDGSVTTIEGNTSANKVARLQRAKGTGRYVRPDYPQAS